MEEVLGWLLPDARAEEGPLVRRVITALRLLREDAREGAGRRAAPSWQHARRELESERRRQRGRALDALLHAYLSALRAADSFLELGERALDYESAWRTLLETGTGLEPTLPPAPAEPPPEVIARLLAAGEANGAPPAWRAWWSCCLRHVAGPLAEAEAHWQARCRSVLAAGARPSILARFVSGLAAARLDRFQPARAWALHERHGDLVPSAPGLRRLLGWSALLSGEEAQARRLLRDLPATALPRPLAELRADRPELSPLLAGSSPDVGEVPVLARTLDRQALGALLAGVFVRRSDGTTGILELDAPVALRARIERRARADWVPAGLAGGADLRRHRRARGEDALPDALAGDESLARVVAAVRAPDGELAGWVQLESAHQLLPSAARLAGLARAWSEAVLAARGEPRGRARMATGTGLAAEPLPLDDPRREFVERLFESLGPLAGLRAYWIELEALEPARLRAERGGALKDWTHRPGGAGIVRRAREQLSLAHHRGERAESVHAGAAAGCALPLVDARAGRARGLLVLESPRSEGPAGEIVGAARAALARLEPVWWSTAFRAAWRAHDGRDLAWETTSRFLAALAPALPAAAASTASILVVGPEGSGRTTLARWVHFLRAGGAHEAPAAFESSVRCPELADLDREAQCELARTARAPSFLRATAPAHVLLERGELVRELARVLDPLPLLVPPLCERRDEIPALVGALASTAARAHARPPPSLDDPAFADLWRQDWRGNVSELGALVAQLVRAHPGRPLGSSEVRAALRSRGLAFRARFSSLRPSALDLELALATTRHRSGSVNLARAARYLGWDVDTLRARLERELE